MFGKQHRIQPMIDPVAKNRRNVAAVDHVAAAVATLIIGLGVVQLVAPFFASPLTGIESGTAATIIAVQWITFGSILALGGLFHLRSLTILAAEFLLVFGLIALGVALLGQHDPVQLLIHGSVAFMGLTTGGLARLTDKADTDRELRLMRAGAKQAAGNLSARIATDDAGEPANAAR